MNATTTERPVDRWFSSYSGDHVNATNQLIHVFCVPAILWSVIALLWCVPVPGTWFGQGVWAAFAMFAAWSYYFRLSRALGIGMLAIFIAILYSMRWLQAAIGLQQLAWLALAVFAVAWVGQFIGHKIEGRKPSFFTDLTYLLIGPLWVLAKLYRKLGIAY